MVNRNSANTWITATSTNERNMPAQPAFLANLSGTDSNCTGDGTAWTLGSGNVFTEIFDQNADFNTNGTFTAPVTGRYQFNSFTLCEGYNATQTSETYNLVTTHGTYRFFQFNPTNFRSDLSYINYMGSGPLVDMDAADTATFVYTSSGGDKTVDIGALCHVSGVLIC